MLYVGGTSWSKTRYQECYTGKTRYYSLARAQAACLELGASCGGVYDGSCDGRMGFRVCRIGYFGTSYGSCVYSPPKTGLFEQESV